MKNINDFISVIGATQANITIDTLLYDLQAIHSAGYAFTDRYFVLVTPDTNNSVTVLFESKEKGIDITKDIKEFVNSLIDHQVRLQLDKANGKIRELIVAHAFSPLNLKKELKNCE